MLFTYPDYYGEFKCSAGECTDTCCSGWQIVIDERSLEKYKKQGNFPALRLGKYIDFKEGVFRRRSDGRCAFLRDDSLCILCREYGEEALCRTCHLYPRHIEEFEGVREITLSLSCPEAAKIILSRETQVNFYNIEIKQNFSEAFEYISDNTALNQGKSNNTSIKNEALDKAYNGLDADLIEYLCKDGDDDYEDFDFLLYSTLCDTRETCLEILKNRKYPIEVRSGMVLGLTHDIDKRLNDGTLFSTSELLSYAVTEAAYAKSAEKVNGFLSNKEKTFEYMHGKFKKLFSLEPIGYSWIDLYTESEYLLYKNAAHYHEWSDKFDKYMLKKSPSLDVQLEQLVTYFIFTYLCGAAYDGCIYGKGKLCVYSAYFIRELLKAAFIKNGGMLSDEELQDIVVRYSRQLEHSDENLIRIEDF